MFAFCRAECVDDHRFTERFADQSAPGVRRSPLMGAVPAPAILSKQGESLLSRCRPVMQNARDRRIVSECPVLGGEHEFRFTVGQFDGPPACDLFDSGVPLAVVWSDARDVPGRCQGSIGRTSGLQTFASRHTEMNSL